MAEAVDGTPRDEEPKDEHHELLPERVKPPETLPEPVQKAELGFPTGPQPPSTYAPRFRMITGALVGVAIGALAATGLLLAGVLGNKSDRAAVAQLLGQAYLTAHVLILHNRDKVERVANVLIDRRELHGDEVVAVLDQVGLRKPDIDLMDDATWPKL